MSARPFLTTIQSIAQLVATAMVAVAAIAMTAATALAAAGRLPWMVVPVTFGDAPLLQAGQIFQVALTLILLMLCVFFPSNLRVMRLEAAHRDFAVRMEDVARAYWAAHRADRTGVFTLHREFDAIRERYQFLRNHPDLLDLDPQIIELASQMSHESRELASIYSDEKVARAREMLDQRRAETERMADRIAMANSATMELRRLLTDVETDEAVIRSQLTRLRADLGDLFASVGDTLAPMTPGEGRRALLKVAPGE